MAKGPEKFQGPREVSSFPSLEKVDDQLQVAIVEGLDIMASHEPVIKEVHDAFVELGDRVREATDVRAEMGRVWHTADRDQEEINSVVSGAVETLAALNAAITRAKREVSIEEGEK